MCLRVYGVQEKEGGSGKLVARDGLEICEYTYVPRAYMFVILFISAKEE